MTQVYAILTIWVSLFIGIAIAQAIINRGKRIDIRKELKELDEIIETNHKRALIMQPFAEHLFPFMQAFDENDVSEDERAVTIQIESFKKVYDLMNPNGADGPMYYCGMKINWI